MFFKTIRVIKVLLVVFVLALMLVNCEGSSAVTGPEDPEVNPITHFEVDLFPATHEIALGDTALLTVEVAPKNAELEFDCDEATISNIREGSSSGSYRVVHATITGENYGEAAIYVSASTRTYTELDNNVNCFESETIYLYVRE